MCVSIVVNYCYLVGLLKEKTSILFYSILLYSILFYSIQGLLQYFWLQHNPLDIRNRFVAHTNINQSCHERGLLARKDSHIMKDLSEYITSKYHAIPYSMWWYRSTWSDCTFLWFGYFSYLHTVHTLGRSEVRLKFSRIVNRWSPCENENYRNYTHFL